MFLQENYEKSVQETVLYVSIDKQKLPRTDSMFLHEIF